MADLISNDLVTGPRRFSAFAVATGFTLLELVIVIALISVLLGLVLPGLGSVNGGGLAENTTRLKLLLNHARQEAMLTSRPWRLEIDLEEDTLRFQQYLGTEFIQVTRAPFSGALLHPDTALNELNINGQPVTESGHVYLFPTGEQDFFDLAFSIGERRRIVSMGQLGAIDVRHQ